MKMYFWKNNLAFNFDKGAKKDIIFYIIFTKYSLKW